MEGGSALPVPTGPRGREIWCHFGVKRRHSPARRIAWPKLDNPLRDKGDEAHLLHLSMLPDDLSFNRVTVCVGAEEHTSFR